MDSYCVIHFKDKPEKIKILTLLATETDADYKVTTDLKKYVAKQFNVTILENDEDVPSANNVETPPIDTLPTAPQQHSSAPIVQPSPIVDKQPRVIETITIKDEIEDIVEHVVPPMADVVDQSNEGNVDPPTMNNNTFHNFIFLQPSDITADQQNLTNVPTTGKDASGVTTAIIKDIPSTSEGNRKRPNYSMVDHNDNETAAKKRKNDERAKVSWSGNNADDCQKCGSFFQGYSLKFDHVLMHIGVMRYECLVDRCGYKASYKDFIVNHMKNNHETQLESFRKNELSHEQTNEMVTIISECFPGMPHEWQCQVCNGSISKAPAKSSKQRVRHVLSHLNIMLYKCMEEGCNREVLTEQAMGKHMKIVHGIVGRQEYYAYKLTEEQELKIQEMLVKCFPKLDDTNPEEVADSNA